MLVVALAAAPLAAAAPDVGTVALGQRIAVKGGGDAVTACNSCHGAHGQGNFAMDFPRLAGQPQAYLLRQLDAYAGGLRTHPVMTPIAKAMSAGQREATAAWFAQLSPTEPRSASAAVRANGPPAAPAAMARGRQLAEQGDARLGVQACSACHGAGNRGHPPDAPALAGQDREYLRAALAAFRAGTRRTDADGAMAAVAATLGAEDLAAVSDYLAGQAVLASSRSAR